MKNVIVPNWPNVFMVSGGLSSALMAIRYSKPEDILIFGDTGREVKGTYKFLDDLENYLGRGIIRTKYRGGYSALVKNYRSVPNNQWRMCTVQLKIEQCKRHLRKMGIQKFNKFLGIRYDEYDRYYEHKERAKKVNPMFPFITDKTTKPEVVNAFNDLPFRLDIPPILGNCDLCFLKGKKAIKAIMRHDPELAKPWIKDEEVTGHTYLKGVSYAQLLSQVQNELPLTGERLEDIKPVFSCTCGQSI